MSYNDKYQETYNYFVTHSNYYYINKNKEIIYVNPKVVKWLNYMLLIMFILLFIFLISEYFILSSLDFLNLYVIIDEIAIFIIAIMLFVYFLFSLMGIKGKYIILMLFIIFVLYGGLILRVIGYLNNNGIPNSIGILFMIRIILLSLAFIFSFTNHYIKKMD